ncbi:MAG: hypothetical protein ACI841_003700, partial [Planctomycetota bacterium]
KFIKYDVEKDEVAKEIAALNGIAHSSQLSHDQTKFFLVTGQRSVIEVLDVATGEFTDQHNFSEPDFIIRVDDVREIPGGTHWYVKIDRVSRKKDHFVIEKPEWLLYDHTEWNIDKRMKELPKAIRSSARISPDGTEWHIMGRDIKILDPESLEEKGIIELSKPMYTGMGPISVRGEDFYDWKNPAAYRMIYRMRDPVVSDRNLTGIVEIDLVEHKIKKLTEWGAAPSVGRFMMTRDKKLGITTKYGGERRNQANGDDPISTLVTYDLETGKRLRETRVELRNGLRLSAISPDGEKLYFMGRGHELVVFNGKHERLKTVELGGEADGRITTLFE